MSRLSSAPGACSRQLWLRAGAPILLLVLVIIVGALTIFWNLAKTQDHEFAQDSRRLVASATEGGTRALSNTTLDFAFWNDAYRATSVHWDQEWIDENFFSAIADGIVVFRDAGVVYSWFATLDGEGADLAANVAARGAGTALDLHQAAAGVVAQDMVRNAFALAGGQLLRVSAAPISWETEAERRAGRRPGPIDYVASVDIITDEELTQMGEALGLGGLTFLPGSWRADDALVGLPVVDHGQRLLGHFAWRNDHPGTAGFLGQVWPIAFGLLLVGGLAILVTRELVARQLEFLLHAEAAVESSRVKSEFIATMSHELRTPLNAIIGYSELIQEEFADADTAREKAVRVDAGYIRGAAGHLLRLVNEILEHARIDAGREPLQLCDVDAAQILSDVVGVIAPLATANGNTLDVSGECDLRVMADSVRLTQCLVNLAGNAAKFTKNGAIEIKTRRAFKDGRDYVAFDVADTGIGIEKAALERLFTPFTQADDTIARDYGGAGLGLSITRKLARAMGGDVAVDSTPRRGSVFTLVVPAATAASLRLVA